MDVSSVGHWPASLQGLAIFVFTFASEDAATFSSGFLAATKVISWPLAFISCFLGIWLGDLGLYGLARIWGRPLAEGMLRRVNIPLRYLEQSEKWFTERGLGALIICRFIPWSRLPTFLVAGLLRVSFPKFLSITGGMALIWVGLIYSLVAIIGPAAVQIWQHWQGGLLAGFFALLGSGLVLWLLILSGQKLARRYPHWEFWPGWLFYLPVVLYYLRLSVKYRGWTLPTAANPSMPTGGLVGESKYDILQSLFASQPEFVARAFLLDAPDADSRVQQLQLIVNREGLVFPFIAKPDVGQRGVGFKIIKDWEVARNYVRTTPGRIVLQPYVPGPFEAGIFYYRFPSETPGRIWGITDKIFPVVVGDGKHTLEELIRRDPRASIVASTYLQRFASQVGWVVPSGEVFRLVEAGNHAQGCIFRDGEELKTPLLEQRIDAISRSIPGFFIGRYDVRYASLEDLQQGRSFQIIELNGAASEVTSIYDSRNTLAAAYRTLFRQWELVFAIGAENRRLGHRPDSVATVWREWQRFGRLSQGYPLAD